jgi:3-dehydroquinate synthase
VGEGARASLAETVRRACPRALRATIVVDATVAALWPPRGLETGLATRVLRVPAGEASKTRRVLARLQDRLIEGTRDEPVVAVGGGAVLDAAGFAAATARRGLPWIALPTTVVAMADAALGGKVAVNHPRGKNLLGTFHPPRAVLADTAFLATLPDRERAAGLAEVYKAARVGDPALLETLRRGPPEGAGEWAAAIHAAAAVKARLVEADERDAGPRRALNYGHTVGHALETVCGAAAMLHGEAVAIGMAVAGAIARARGVWTTEDEERQCRDLEGMGLPTRLPEGATPDAILGLLALDKKRRPGAHHTFVLPRRVGVVIVEDVTTAEIVAALAARASASSR